jgi:hypothetical protein
MLVMSTPAHDDPDRGVELRARHARQRERGSRKQSEKVATLEHVLPSNLEGEG